MQTQSSEIKLQFRTREGYYRLMNSPDYSQRAASGFNIGTTSNEKTCIKVSLVTVNDSQEEETSSTCDSPKKICFNVGRELFVYNYDGVKAGPDGSNPIYKHSYKGSMPTCHDFNQTTASSSSLSLLVGFSHGQCQLIEMNSLGTKETCREFNLDRQIDKTRVTCIKWLPHSTNQFLVSHVSGRLYLYNVDTPCGASVPVYQLHKQGDGVLVYTCKSKTTRNPIYMWVIGTAPVDVAAVNNCQESSYCSINQFAFSDCAKYFACVSQDGFLRVYCYDTMEMIDRARSYYGGLTCICWSPDGRYIVTGGEDDLVTVWSFVKRQVVARGAGHKSWVTVVAFDPFYPGFTSRKNEVKDHHGDRLTHEDESHILDTDEGCFGPANKSDSHTSRSSPLKYLNDAHYISHTKDNTNSAIRSYRFGSVGQDTQLCLWELNDDILSQPVGKPKVLDGVDAPEVVNQIKSNTSVDRREKFGSQKRSNKNSHFKTNLNIVKPDEDPVHLLGTRVCPRMNEIPLLEPIVCKKISLESLTSLQFCSDGFITSCQEGLVFSWARPSDESMSDCRSNEDMRVIDVVTSSVRSAPLDIRNYWQYGPTGCRLKTEQFK